jgi:SAM-dependent methyltransferase
MSKVIDYWRQEPAKAQASDILFLNWFNSCKTLEESVRTGAIDFFHRIFTPDLYTHLGDTAEKTCLEIGFGGGRLLNYSAKVFKHAYGVDIHDSFDKTRQILESQGNHNFTLLKQIDRDTIKANSIDFVYSYIVFQHFDSWETAESYLTWIHKILSPSGVAVIYLGKSSNIENFTIHEDPVSQALTLIVRPDFLKAHLSDKFEILACETALVKHLWSSQKSNQFLVKFKKRSDT